MIVIFRIAPYHIDLLSALEFVTQGLARATSHRVLSPKGTTPRYSVPFFQNIGLNIRLTDQIVQCPWFVFGTISILSFLDPLALPVPPEILKLRDARGSVAATDCMYPYFLPWTLLDYIRLTPAVNFTEFDREPSGRVNLIGRVKYVSEILTDTEIQCLSLGVIRTLRKDITLSCSSSSSLRACRCREVRTERWRCREESLLMRIPECSNKPA